MEKYIIKQPPYIDGQKYGYPTGTPCEICAEDLKALRAAGIEIVKEGEEVEAKEAAPLTAESPAVPTKTKKGK